MNTKYIYFAIITNKEGAKVSLSYSNGFALNVNTGKSIEINLKTFIGIVKKYNGTVTKKSQLKLGEYININTGKVEKLFGIA